MRFIRDTVARRRKSRASQRRGRAPTLEKLEHRTLLAVHSLEIGPFRGRPGQFGVVDGTTLFTTSDPGTGHMLWATDGTPQGTRLVRDIDPQPPTAATWFLSGRDNALTVGDTFYFTAVDQAHGRELWRSDGTSAGTKLVADLVPGPGDSEPEGFIELKGKLLFAADRKLWATDGTAAGTVMVMDADPLGYSDPERMAVMNGHAYFTVYPSHSPYGGDVNTGQLWRTDGTPDGTVMIRDISPGADPTDVSTSRMGLINVGGTLYFAANDGTHGYELWRSDGTKRGTLLVRDIAPPPANGNTYVDGSYPDNLTDVNGTLFFSADGFLWKTDGTGAGTVKLKTVSSPRGFVNVNGMLYFVSNDHIWVSDGTRGGTRQVADGAISERFGGGSIGALNGRVWFAADGGSGFELYETDGTPSHTSLAHEAQPGPESSHPQVLGRVGTKLIFTAREERTASWYVYNMDLPSPYAPSNVKLRAGSDTGRSDDDRVTNVARPTFSGEAPPDSVVRLLANGNELGTAIARGGTFTITSNFDLAPGTYTITASAIDDLRRASPLSAPMNVKIDSSAPRVRFKALSPELLELKFTEYVGDSIGPDDLALRNLDTGDEIGAAEMRVSYTARTNTAQISFPNRRGGLAEGRYRLTLDGSGVHDVAGNMMASPTAVDFSPPSGPTVGVAGSVLRITGTDASDEMLVRLQEGAPNRIEVVVNGQRQTHAASSVSQIIIDALAGDDLIRFDNTFGAVKIRSKIYAGDGNDSIHGSATRDRVYAGAGDDVVRGGGGHDILYGEAGDDTLFGERHNDYIVGGAGNDVMQGNHGVDRLIFETGLDRVESDASDELVSELA